MGEGTTLQEGAPRASTMLTASCRVAAPLGGWVTCWLGSMDSVHSLDL